MRSLSIYCIYCILSMRNVFSCILLHVFSWYFFVVCFYMLFACILHAFHMLLPVFFLFFFTCFVMLLTSNALCTSCGKKCMQKTRVGMWHGMCCILCQEKRPSKAWLQFRQGVGHSWPSFLELGHSNV